MMKIAKPPRPEVLEEVRYRKEHKEELRAEAKRKLVERRKGRLQLMDKAAKVAVEKYPHGTFNGELGDSLRAACAVGYMQAEKDLLPIITAARKVFESWKAGEAWMLYTNMEELGNLLKDKRND